MGKMRGKMMQHYEVADSQTHTHTRTHHCKPTPFWAVRRKVALMILIVSAILWTTNMIQRQESTDRQTECSIDRQGSFSSKTVFFSISSTGWNGGCCHASPFLIIGCGFAVWNRNPHKIPFFAPEGRIKPRLGSVSFTSDEAQAGELDQDEAVDDILQEFKCVWLTHSLSMRAWCSNLAKISCVACCCSPAAHKWLPKVILSVFLLFFLMCRHFCFPFISRLGSNLGVCHGSLVAGL